MEGNLQVLIGPWLLPGVPNLSVRGCCMRPLILSVLLYGSVTILWMDKERSRIRVVQIDNLRCLLGIKRMDRVPNTRIRELCGVVR